MASSLARASAGASGLRLTDGGYSTYSTSGTTMRETTPGTEAARAHWPHVISVPVRVKASLADSGLAAMEVRNMALDTQEVWKHVTKRYAPIFRSVPSPLLLPQAWARAVTRGRKMPPARAATEGMAGARSASLSTSEYVSPRDVLPNSATRW